MKVLSISNQDVAFRLAEHEIDNSLKAIRCRALAEGYVMRAATKGPRGIAKLRRVYPVGKAEYIESKVGEEGRQAAAAQAGK